MRSCTAFRIVHVKVPILGKVISASLCQEVSAEIMHWWLNLGRVDIQHYGQTICYLHHSQQQQALNVTPASLWMNELCAGIQIWHLFNQCPFKLCMQHGCLLQGESVQSSQTLVQKAFANRWDGHWGASWLLWCLQACKHGGRPAGQVMVPPFYAWHSKAAKCKGETVGCTNRLHRHDKASASLASAKRPVKSPCRNGLDEWPWPGMHCWIGEQSCQRHATTHGLTFAWCRSRWLASGQDAYLREEVCQMHQS
jgi:hypothetical protein